MQSVHHLFNFPQGESEYEEWKYHKNKNIVEVIQDFSSLKVPAALLLTQLPRLQPVSYLLAIENSNLGPFLNDACTINAIEVQCQVISHLSEILLHFIFTPSLSRRDSCDSSCCKIQERK